MPKTGNNGLNGERNGRSRSGLVMRNTITPKHTNTKAAKVPILTSSASSPKGTKPAISAIMKPHRIITLTGD